ncbi:MAG: LysR family transcriptional regulator [Hyphomicrobiales bacterium]|nr:MAG: LysR family transcriptional regulator [Hyphomicrobiales bacterium]
MSDINSIKLRQLDLTLLTVFSEVMRHRKLTVVAERLGLTQSAISHSLKRLRRAFDDELFMRRPFGVEPTQRAMEIAERVERIILLSQEIVGEAQTFEPSSSQRLFRIAGADQQIALFAPLLIRRVRRHAPGVRLSFRPQMREEALKALADGELDVAIGLQRAPGTEYVHRHLFNETYRVLARKEQPQIKRKLTLKTYLELDHVLVSFNGGLRGIVDVSLAKLGKSRRVVASVPSFFPAFAVVAETDAVATVPARMAEHYRSHFGLVCHEPPVEIRSFAVHALWHRRNNNDAGLKWLVDGLAAIAAG